MRCSNSRLLTFHRLPRRPKTTRISISGISDLLARAIEGRGAFRRFKDVPFGFPDLREEWFAFHDKRATRRAVEWLVGEGVIAECGGEAGVAQIVDAGAPVGAVYTLDGVCGLGMELRG